MNPFGIDIDAQVKAERMKTLSPREREVVLAMEGGERVSQIARRLGLSPKTVSTHRARAREKLGEVE